MTKLLQYLFLSLTFAFTAFAQEKASLSTPSWSFMSDSYSYSGILDVQINKDNKGGIVQLQLQVSDPSFYIGGNVYLFLEDGNVITCTDKNIRSVSGKNIQASYVITPTEVALLKKLKLTDVRFRIIGNATDFSSPTGFFTASNRIRSFGLPDKTFDTVAAINQLFN
ncbi:hypothetical protein [Flavobacterium sp. SM2513]|uniref:hypothetical protein n=1 Tax=Flavobacterium sp. SM2513 TaxID=3424766 RepID=UPI003D7F4782